MARKPELVKRDDVKKLIDDMIEVVKADGIQADLALRALGLKVCGLPPAGPVEAKWERYKDKRAQFPYWRCSACQQCCYTTPDGLERVYYCPVCGSHTGGVVDEG